MHRLLFGLALALFVITPATRGWAQSSSSLTDTDIQRLRTAITDARADVDKVQSRDQQLAASLSKELDGLSDEVTYLSVKLRKEQQVPRSEGLDLRDRIDDVRTRARGSDKSAAPAAPTIDEIPVGTEIDVRLLDPLSSGRNQVEDRFRATTIVDLRIGERVVIPAGSEMRGVITSLDKAGRVDRKGNMTLAFDQITVDGTRYAMRGTVTKAFEGEGIKGEAGKLGVGAAVGGIIGGIVGGAKGAVAGVLIGGGGVAAATPGTEAELEPGTILRVRLDQPPPVAPR
jgi:hypothetical protein